VATLAFGCIYVWGWIILSSVDGVEACCLFDTFSLITAGCFIKNAEHNPALQK
jgi:hypothetical protein